MKHLKDRRHNSTRLVLIIISSVLAIAQGGFAQSSILGNMNFEVGGGVTPTVGQSSIDLTTGWNVIGGIGYDFDHPLGVRFEFMYNGLGVSPSALQQVNVPAGNAHMWSLTLDPVWRFARLGPVHVYAIVGGGYYRRTVQFTQPTVAIVNIFNPWWGYFGPALVPANEVLGTVTKGAGGANGGLGVSMRVGRSNARLYIETRYHYVWTSTRATEILPITFGIRW